MRERARLPSSFPGTFPAQTRVREREKALSSLAGGFAAQMEVDYKAVMIGSAYLGICCCYRRCCCLLFLPLWKLSRMRSEAQRRSAVQGWLEDRRGAAGTGAGAGEVAGAVGRWQLLSSRPGYLVLGAGSCVESVPVPVPGAVLL